MIANAFASRRSPDLRRIGRLATPALCAMLAVVVGCDDGRWRAMRPPELGLSLEMPCRPARTDRRAELAGRPRAMALWSCTHGSWTYAVLRVPLAEPAEVDAAMAALLETARSRLSGRSFAESSATVPGMTPHRQALHLAYVGPMPDGTHRHWRTEVFRHGLTVFQASAIGAASDGSTADTFFASMKVLP